VKTISKIQFVDSHTGGEPTRVVIAGGPDLGSGTLVEKRNLFRENFNHLRAAMVNEPRGNDVIVGALLCPPEYADSLAGVIFFNNVGVLNMCGHGTIGLAVTLAHLGRMELGTHRIDTPVGTVSVELLDKNYARIENVPSYRYRSEVTVDVPGHGAVTGDIAWGGNWFYLVNDHGQDITPGNVRELTDFTLRIRQALERDNITGENGGLIDHIDLFGPPGEYDAQSRNFVLCPGGAYDRSPCGTGTSAKLACLVADGKLQPGEVYRQASVIGSILEGTVRMEGTDIIPSITGSAFVTAEGTLLLNSDDPFQFGVPAQ